MESKAEGALRPSRRTTATKPSRLDIGTHQFRLRQIDVRGTAHSSDPMTVKVRMEEAYRLTSCPNPPRRQATVKLAAREKQEARLVLYDVLSRRVATLHGGPVPEETKEFTLDAWQQGLPSGTYFLRLVGRTARGRVGLLIREWGSQDDSGFDAKRSPA